MLQRRMPPEAKRRIGTASMDSRILKGMALYLNKRKRVCISLTKMSKFRSADVNARYVFVALSYAYLQLEEPSSWKFNKARQNWLLRNVWSEEAVSLNITVSVIFSFDPSYCDTIST